MRKLTVAMISSVVVMAGCAAPSWQQQGKTQRDAENALNECQYQVKLAKLSQREATSAVRSCMKGKGFRFD